MAVKLLIDADLIAYKAGFATDRTKYLVETANTYQHFDDAKSANEHKGEGAFIWSRKDTDPEDKALMICDVMIGEIHARYAHSNPSVSLYLTNVANFRHSIATRANYKGGRVGSVPPAHLKAIRQHLVSKHGASLVNGQEADDAIMQAWNADKSSIIVSVDKDFNQAPATIYNFTTKEEVTISKKDATLNFYQQVITGDPTDSIPGCTGLGPVKAKKLLANAKTPWECWQIALGCYVKEWGDLAGPLYALECANLVYLRRVEGEAWSPPNAPAKAQQAA